jgi:hypothetical protein
LASGWLIKGTWFAVGILASAVSIASRLSHSQATSEGVSRLAALQGNSVSRADLILQDSTRPNHYVYEVRQINPVIVIDAIDEG